MAPDSGSSGSKYWYKVSVQAVRVWTFLVVLAVVAFIGIFGYGSLRRHFVSKQVQTAMDEARNLMSRLSTEDDLYNFRTEWAQARSSLETARNHVVEGEIEDALRNAERSRTLLLRIHEGLLKRTGGEAQFIAVYGQVEYRRGEQGEWTSARNLTALYEGDYIKTSGNSSAEVMTVDGSLFTVRPDTVILVSSSRSPTSSRREQTIALESGWVNLSTSQATGRIKTPSFEAEVATRSDVSLSYDDRSGRSEVAAFRGQVAVVSKTGDKRELTELERVTGQGERLAATQKLPEAPALLEPQNNKEIPIAGAPEVTLTWEPVKGASRYALQVSTNKLFVDNVIDIEDRKRPRARLGVRGEGSFVWRVAAINSSGAKGPWSLYNRFRVTSEQPSGVPGAR